MKTVKRLLLGLSIVCCLFSFIGCEVATMFESPKAKCTYRETDDFIVKSKRTNSYTDTHYMQVGKVPVPMSTTYTDYYVTIENPTYGTYEVENQTLYNRAPEGTYVQANFYSDGKVAYFKIPDYNVESSLLTIIKK